MKKRFLVSFVLWPSVALAQQGAWETPPFFFGNDPIGNDAIVAVNLVHVFDGSVGKVVALTFDSCTLPRLWTPPPVDILPTDPGYAGVFESIPNICPEVLFCGGHSALADGRFLHAGGIYTPLANLFDPRQDVGSQWRVPRPPNMTASRWYPTCTTLGDGRVLVTSGYSSPTPTWATIPEIYDPANNRWMQLGSATRQHAIYPCMFVLPDGNLLDAGAGFEGASRILVSSPTWAWGPVLPDPTFPFLPEHMRPGYPGAAVMYEPDTSGRHSVWDGRWSSSRNLAIFVL